MSTLRIKKDRTNPFVQLFTSMFEDKNISLKAKGLLGFCMTKTEDWVFYIDQLAATLKEGHKAINNALNELIQNGYAIRYQSRKEDGDFDRWETIISDSKAEIDRVKKDMEESGEFQKIFAERRFARAHFAQAQKDVLPNKDVREKNQSKKKPPTPTPSKKPDKIEPREQKEGGGGFPKSDNLDCISPYPCFNPFDIPDFDKRRITRDYPENIVIAALMAVSQEGFKPKKTLTHAIIYFCKNPSHVTKSEKQLQKEKQLEEDKKNSKIAENRNYAHKVTQRVPRKSHVTFFEPSSMQYMQVYNGLTGEKENLYYSDPKFQDLIIHLMNKWLN